MLMFPSTSNNNKFPYNKKIKHKREQKQSRQIWKTSAGNAFTLYQQSRYSHSLIQGFIQFQRTIFLSMGEIANWKSCIFKKIEIKKKTTTTTATSLNWTAWLKPIKTTINNVSHLRIAVAHKIKLNTSISIRLNHMNYTF